MSYPSDHRGMDPESWVGLGLLAVMILFWGAYLLMLLWGEGPALLRGP